MLSCGNKFMFQRIGEKAIFNQTFHNSGDYEGVVNWAVVCRVAAFALFINGYNHRGFNCDWKVRH